MGKSVLLMEFLFGCSEVPVQNFVLLLIKLSPFLVYITYNRQEVVQLFSWPLLSCITISPNTCCRCNVSIMFVAEWLQSWTLIFHPFTRPGLQAQSSISSLSRMWHGCVLCFKPIECGRTFEAQNYVIPICEDPAILTRNLAYLAERETVYWGELFPPYSALSCSLTGTREVAVLSEN